MIVLIFYFWRHLHMAMLPWAEHSVFMSYMGQQLYKQKHFFFIVFTEIWYNYD